MATGPTLVSVKASAMLGKRKPCPILPLKKVAFAAL